MKIYTKKGDKGQTSLLGGTRVLKSHLRIEAYGTVDELNSYIGLLVSLDEISEGSKNVMVSVQSSLFTIGSELACESATSNSRIPHIQDVDTVMIEKEIDRFDKRLPVLKGFILPGGHAAVAHCHIARCICRRAERMVVRLSQEQIVPGEIITFLNRLSDYLFMLARITSYDLGIPDILWKA